MDTTTIYIPTRIGSAEQAEALPVGTIALLGPERPEAFENAAAVKVGPEETSEGVPLWLVRSQGTADDARMVGWTALVPIEAEEEWGVEVREGGDPDDAYVIRAADRENAEWRISTLDIPWTRIVRRIGSTPWEAAR